MSRPRRRPSPRAILITGASSGLGAALARHYAAAGVRLFLHGRDDARLAAVAAACTKAGAAVETHIGEVTDAAAMAAWIAACDHAQPLDLVIANAGISGGTAGGPEGADQVRRIFAVNVDGVLNTVLPAVAAMTARGQGQIAVMSSIAGFLGLPNAPAYCASKTAVKTLGEGMRGPIAAAGVAVTVICPGYVKTPMTDANDFTMPFLMSVERAAGLIAAGLAANKARIAFPWPMVAAVRLLALLPPDMLAWLMARLPAKSELSEAAGPRPPGQSPS
ncbi:MAG: SDR family NAD(P)-dependent oxidoreductase [Pseudomonadota bacterium]|nr:SDR family NAD(P)-dependent oxidoreductase [Pseudomonadota bacterium]